MKTQIVKTMYKDIEAVSVENTHLRVVFLPGFGGKMASLADKKSGREFLVQADGESYKKLGYAGSYVDAECSGFDDMFPTIDTWTYNDYPWCGAEMPDHGEVCGLPWGYEVEEDGGCLHCWVYGVRFPYRLDKWIRFSGESELCISYKARNLSPFDMNYIWAAHVMLNAERGARILTPYDDGAAATCVFSGDEDFAMPGMAIQWPKTKTQCGGTSDISITESKAPDGNSYKYYFDAPVPEGWSGYQYESDGTRIFLKVSKETVPYLGIWVNNGAFKNYYNMALEPCSGTYDDPQRAVQHGQGSVLPGGGEQAWQLSFCVESGRGGQ